MQSGAVHPLRVHAEGASPPRRPLLVRSTPRWLGPYFWAAGAVPGLVRGVQPLAARLATLASREVRANTRCNAERIFGRRLRADEAARFSRGVIGSFCEFLTDMGSCSHASREELLSRVDAVHGEREYLAARAERRGAVLVTAHMGSFELGLAALSRVEPRVHVVFQRDASGAFDAMRSRVRSRLGVIESPIDDGVGSWLGLREALVNDGVVVLQGDRAVPGQRSQVVPFLHGHLRIPTGPVRLARITGSPIVPVFTVRNARGGREVLLFPPIDPAAGEGSEPDVTVLAVAAAIETVVQRYPEQWLVLRRAFEEDQNPAG
ncbi:MAG: lysophospholipid acyltransferase family protein [Phycisphaerales bacterium]